MKILSVDDSATIRRIIKNIVDVLGYEFLEAADGQAALDILAKEYADVGLVLLDWNMPVLNGYDTLKAIKADGRFKNIPVTMVTTESERIRVIEAIKAGAKNYVTKPFTQDELTNKIMQCLGMGF